MEKFFTVAQVIAPIIAAILLGVYARRKAMLTAEHVQGLQQFVIKFALPCVLFNSCFTARIGVESLTSMALVLPVMVISTLFSFCLRKKLFPYHNLPQLFAAQETGMLGIPLFMILFGADQAYRVGVLDFTQAATCIPVIALLTADAGENPTFVQIIKKIFSSPLLLMGLLGLGLNLSGAAAWMDSIGIGGLVSETTSFLAQPVSAVMLFSVGFNFSLEKGSRGDIFKLSAVHFILFAVFGVMLQLVMLLIPGMDDLTRWAVLLYCSMPGSYLAPGLGRTQEDFTVISGVCSVLTVVSLMIFCVMAAVAA